MTVTLKFLVGSLFIIGGCIGFAHAADQPSSSTSRRSSLGPISPEKMINDNDALNRTRPFANAEKIVYFVNIKNGDKVRSPFRVGFVVSGIGVAPVKAGKLDNTGHHHILIDVKSPLDPTEPIPFDNPNEYQKQHYKHFERGETETVLDLPVGRHTLKLVFGDYTNRPLTAVSSREIYIDVIER